MDINVEDVKKLRDETGVSISKCKEALVEAQGDFDKARDVLREFSQKAASKTADRDLGAGLVVSYVHTNGQAGTIIELNSETDFVARNDDFGALANDIAMHITAMNPENLEELLSQPFVKNPEISIEQLIKDAIQKLGERIEIGSFHRIEVLGN